MRDCQTLRTLHALLETLCSNYTVTRCTFTCMGEDELQGWPTNMIIAAWASG